MIADAWLLLTTAWRLSSASLVLQFLLLLLNGLFGGISLLLLVPIVNSVSDGVATLSVPVGAGISASAPLPVLLAAFVLLIAVQSAIAWLSAVSATGVQHKLVDSMRHAAFAAVLGARWEFVLRQRRSDIVATVTIGASRAGAAYGQLMLFAASAVLALAAAVVAVLVSPIVGLVAVAVVTALGLVQFAAVRPAHTLGRQLGQRQRDLQAVVTDSLDSLRLVRAHDASSVWIERISDAFAGTREIQLSTVRQQATRSGVSAIALAVGASALVLACVGVGLSAGALAVLLVVALRLAASARQMASAAALMANALPAVRDLTDLTTQANAAAEAGAHESEPRRPLNCADGTALLSFDEVSYAYPDAAPALHDVSVEIAAGRVTAVSGPSGAGKSTLVDLALGLLAPTSGQVRVAGRVLGPSELSAWRSHVAYVPQETVLVPGTLRDNLVWSSGGTPSDDECWSALDLASADFARSLPSGLDTPLGDRGWRLSGGERQRVAIARGLLRNPDLLVLDEATSALDDRTERQIIDLLKKLTPQVTVLLIAHRGSALQAADVRIWLDEGRVVAG